MKIVAGLGSIDEYTPYVEAGADELFCGYVPEKWALKYGMMSPLNRREVLYYNVQIGSRSELEILQKMIQHYKVPVTMTFNSLYYTPEQYPIVLEIIRECMELGFHSFIIADPALLLYISQNISKNASENVSRNTLQNGLKQSELDGIRIHMSGETAEVNHKMIDEMRKFHISRVIFHRKNTLEDMSGCIAHEIQRFPGEPLEYEAFALNEMCHFTGAFCNSLHCDELTHICRLPYRLGMYEKSETAMAVQNSCGCAGNQFTQPDNVEEDADYLTGRTGCGLCALWKMQQAGITHLKLVSRGNYVDDTMEDIRQLRKALKILAKSNSEQEYKKAMRKELFKGNCSHSCYYLQEKQRLHN